MSIFTTDDVAAFQRDRLLTLARAYFPTVTPDPAYLLQAIQAAEQDLETQLRVFFEPVEVLTMSTPDSERSALVAAGKRIADDPGYPSDQGFFQGEKWGMTQLRYRPVISISSVTFNYPSTADALYVVPPDWIRCDKKRAEFQLVPTSNFAAFPITSLLLASVTSGTEIPYFLQVRYRAGLENARATEPALVDLIFKMASLRVLDDLFLPSSGSISADGLSQSISMDASKYQDTIDKRIETLRQRFQGIRMMVM